MGGVIMGCQYLIPGPGRVWERSGVMEYSWVMTVIRRFALMQHQVLVPNTDLPKPRHAVWKVVDLGPLRVVTKNKTFR